MSNGDNLFIISSRNFFPHLRGDRHSSRSSSFKVPADIAMIGLPITSNENTPVDLEGKGWGSLINLINVHAIAKLG